MSEGNPLHQCLTPTKIKTHVRGGLNISNTNACSVENKWHELRELSLGSDLIAITETWLKPDIDIESFCPPGYLIYRVDRSQDRIGGGSLLLIAQQYNQLQGSLLNLTSVQVSSCTVAKLSKFL